MAYLKLRILTTVGVLLALGSPPPPRDALSGPEVYHQALQATVLIVTPTRGKGTGWLLDREKRLVVTNLHVVGDNDTVDVHFPAFDGRRLITERSYYVENRRALEDAGRLVRGRVLHKETACDLALLELASVPDDARALPLAVDSPSPGERVHTLGNRGDLEMLWTFSSGVIRQVLTAQEGYFWRGKQLAKGARVVITQSPINEGDSGGPLLNERGELVAVLAAVQWQTQLASIGIDVREVRAFLDRAGKEQPRPSPREPPQAGVRDLYARLLSATAWVRAGGATSRSTGWLLDRARKLLVTSLHAVGSHEVVEVIFPVFQEGKPVVEHRFYRDNERLLKQRGHLVRGRVVARDARRGLALLELDTLPTAVSELPLAAGTRPGERVHTIGNPNGVEGLWIYSAGTIRQLGHVPLGQTDEKPDPAVLLVQLPSSSNDSGGALVNDAGELVGVVTGKEAPQQLVTYGLDVGEVKAFLYEARPRWDPHSASDFRQRGAALARAGRNEPAVSAYDRAIRLDADNASLLAERGGLHRRKGDLGRALADCDAALRLNPRLPLAYVERAAVRNQQGQPDEARADCAAALRLDPKCAAAFAERSNSQRLKGNLDLALTDGDEAVWLDQRQTSAYYYRGLALTAKGELDRALIDLGRAIELDPFLPFAHRQRGDVYRLKNEADKALADYVLALELNSRDALAFQGRGRAWALKNRHELAVADFSRALEIDPRLVGAYLDRGISRMRQGDHERAMADYAEGIRRQRSLANNVLREVQQRAAELSAGERADVARCADLCRRTLMTLQSLFETRADVRKTIGDGLTAAGRETDLREQAQQLRAVIGAVRLLIEGAVEKGN